MVKNSICAIVNVSEDSSKLRPLTNHRPIALLPFAGRYRSIDFILSDISYAEINSVGLFIGESGRSIYDHVRSGSSWHLESLIRGGIFTFSHQDWKREHHFEDKAEDFYYNHRLFMQRSRAQYIFVTGSKIIANVDIKAIRRHHQSNGDDITIVYKHLLDTNISEQDKLSDGIIFDENHEVRSFTEKPIADEDGKINLSLNMYFLSVEKMLQIIEKALEDGIYLELNDLIRHYINACSLSAYEYTGYAANIDTIDKYYAANMDMLNFATFSSLFHTSIPILTKPKHGSPAYYDVESEVRHSFVGTDSYIAGEVKQSILNRRVDVGKDASILNSIVFQGTKVGEGARIEYAIIDKNSIIEPGAQVIGTPDNIAMVEKGAHIYPE